MVGIMRIYLSINLYTPVSAIVVFSLEMCVVVLVWVFVFPHLARATGTGCVHGSPVVQTSGILTSDTFWNKGDDTLW